VLGVSGGSSVGRIFRKMRSAKINWKKLHLFMVDERCVPLNSEFSNFRLVRKELVDYLVEKGKLPEKNVHPYNHRRGVEEYENELREIGGRFDIALLSAGEDCHIASLFPNRKPSGKKALFVEELKSPKPPKRRISASPYLIENTKVAVLLFFGDKKRAAFEKFRNEEISSLECPGKIVGKVKESWILTDLI